ncbi:exodeoxyribonuclease V subunit alpha [Marinobacter salicampi]|uniref:exodeoxyribonuclease V subunit alpha n=1 Tax=Marinobacter salicampi TaxID=435907 RepID=UPI00140BCBCC|nr:exodeoxyribonuclease V subunit alpha [Marinobacter salicampi]
MSPEQFELGLEQPGEGSVQPDAGIRSEQGVAELAPGRHALASVDALIDLLQRWVDLGWLRPLDVALARFLAQEAQEAGQPASPLLLLAIALASHQLGRGHVCLDLNGMVQHGFNDALSLPPEDEAAPEQSLLPSEILAQVSLEQWREALAHPLLVTGGAGVDTGKTPLVRDGLRLYLRRYWQYEQVISHQITSRLSLPGLLQAPDSDPAVVLRSALQSLFPSSGDDTSADWQRIACANAARLNFSVITGGPGTGKTTTVVRLLAALQCVAMAKDSGARPLRIRLAAPTGKAAARLNESISNAVAKLDLSGLPRAHELKEAIPTSVTTLHRLLGSLPGSRQFRHHRHNPLVLDTLVIDEASMVDIEMMASVLEAMPPRARLILLGDKDQLASVDAGAVLGELCQRAADGHYSEQTATWLAQVAGQTVEPGLVDSKGELLDQAVTLLRKSFRFAETSGIGTLAQSVNAGAGLRRLKGLFNEGFSDIALVRLQKAGRDSAICRHAIEGGAEHFVSTAEQQSSPVGYRHYLAEMLRLRPPTTAPLQEFDAWARALLEAYGQFQLLCALRRGPYGVEGLNEVIADALHRAGLIRSAHGWYPGRPVLVTRNDYSLGLMNGDVGLTLELPARLWASNQEAIDPETLVQRVAFAATDGSAGIRWVLPSRLQAVETVYAMTVHKAQGSEFSHASLVLPDKLNPVLTRELVYTGITRAKHWFSLLLPDERVFEYAVKRQVLRTSGLGRALGVK